MKVVFPAELLFSGEETEVGPDCTVSDSSISSVATEAPSHRGPAPAGHPDGARAHERQLERETKGKRLKRGIPFFFFFPRIWISTAFDVKTATCTPPFCTGSAEQKLQKRSFPAAIPLSHQLKPQLFRPYRVAISLPPTSARGSQRSSGSGKDCKSDQLGSRLHEVGHLGRTTFVDLAPSFWHITSRPAMPTQHHPHATDSCVPQVVAIPPPV